MQFRRWFWSLLVVLAFVGLFVAPTRAHASGPSGVPMPVGDRPGYHQIFTDDFTQSVPLGSFPSAVADRWSAYPNWFDTSYHGIYLSNEVLSQHDGMLDWYLHTNSQGQHAVAAPLPIVQAGSHPYGSGLSAGAYVVRFGAQPGLACYKTAWLLWPDDDNWPQDGEIDYPEGALDSTMSAYLHHEGATSENDQDGYDTTAGYTVWHTAIIDWRPDLGYTDFYLDGVDGAHRIGHSTSRIPNTPMHLVLQTETGANGCVPSSTTQGHVVLDWIAVYAPAATTPFSL